MSRFAAPLSRMFSYETALTSGMLVLLLGTFFAFGVFHLGKFETTDEHLWKYDRIGQYWEALSNHEWEKTYINDKPGITVALISGIGLLFEPHPEQTVMTPRSGPEQNLFESYNVAISESVNKTFRLPVLVFATLSLLGFFFLLQSAFGSRLVALLGTLFLAQSPILLGMSQIINPDSFFWVFGALASLSYIALEETGKLKFLVLCGILTGFALLSKYTAFTLFLFYTLYLVGKMLFQNPDTARETTLFALVRQIRSLVLIFLLAISVFAFFLPAVFLNPELLFKGISQFFTLETVLVVSVLALVLVLLGFFLRNVIGTWIAFLAHRRRAILLVVLSAFLLLVFVTLLNVWTGERLAEVDMLRDTAYANEPKEFNFKPLLDRKDGSLITTARLFLMEAHPLIFSLPPLTLLLIVFTFGRVWKRTLSNQTSALLFSILLFTLLYLVSTLGAKVVTNVRYLIILYPLWAILSAVLLHDLLREKTALWKNTLWGVILALYVLGALLLFSLRPFYFSYTNALLPEEFSIHDSWGHGSYEAATYLNALPKADNLVIWSNSDTVCRFFVGRCLKSRRIDLARVTPDYFVISKRGAIKISNRFLFTNNPNPKKDSGYYFDKLENGAVWELFINNREANFIKIIPFEK